MQQIAILGCGWLGQPLALALQNAGYGVKVSRRDPNALAELRQQGLHAYALDITEVGIEGQWQGFCEQVTSMIVMLPPRSKSQHPDRYRLQIDSLCHGLRESHVQRLIFISSTGVYQKHNTPLTETSPLVLESALVYAEQVIQSVRPTCTLRFSGLVGPARIPGRFLAGKQLDAGLTPVNLIHQQDCIGVILAVLAQQTEPKTYNVSSATQATRQDFYTLAARQADLPAPQFSTDNSLPLCRVNSDKLMADLNYQFTYPDITKWLTHDS
ncbi:NAD-dependent epimerase/dehydratase family protein [Motilimonas pumila]|uniref:NAD-dependent epimerase/dehydratase family protein n=1 Tax=Motilimonas pumila TaxID=2303987 RepID=A0A418YHL9_9GAMM|nr:NAD-dependent epimerase/dehydratase family protein [Motilimonas pumila]RJG49555.1 NAD-dependent epimerase/dehydratase family protein [Motilimonas pumila]